MNGRHQFKFWIPVGIAMDFMRREKKPYLDPTRSSDQATAAALLDERLAKAEFSEILDGTGEPTFIGTYGSGDGRMIACVRRHNPARWPETDTAGGPGSSGRIVVGLATMWEAQENFARGVWRRKEQAASSPRATADAPGAAPVTTAAAEPDSTPKTAHRGGRPGCGPDPDAILLRGAHSAERLEFSLATLRARPSIRHSGEDGLNKMLTDKFGIGISGAVFNKIRQKVVAERAPSAPQPARAASSGVDVQELSTASADLARALRHRDEVARGLQVLQNNLADADRMVAEAQARVTAALGK